MSIITRHATVSALSLFAVLLAANASSPVRAEHGAAAAVDDKTIIHVLNRLGFGPTPAAIARVRHLGVQAYIDGQLQPATIDDSALQSRLSRLVTLDKTSRQLAEAYDQRGPEPRGERRRPLLELSEQRLLRAIYSERQLEEVLVDFWFNHFNVFAGKGVVRIYLSEYERTAIRPHVLGKFRDLLGAVARSPAMLLYLDNWQSSAAPGATTSPEPGATSRPGSGRQLGRPRPRGRSASAAEIAPDAQPPARRRGLNENYARELMELHTLGVDGGYSQQDVQDVARAFTGWTVDQPRRGGPYRFDPRRHDDDAKMVLGERLAAGGGERDGGIVLDLLAQHPATARLIATKLARRFVADEPPPALVARAASCFTATGGDLREVVRTIVTSTELFAPAVYRGKVKSPLEFVASAVRASRLELASAAPLLQALRDLGMPLYEAQPPTGYPDRAAAWVNTGALLNRMNFAVALTNGQMLRRQRVTSTPTAPIPPPVDIALPSLITHALAGDLSRETAAILARASSSAQAAALLLGSPEFQKR